VARARKPSEGRVRGAEDERPGALDLLRFLNQQASAEELVSAFGVTDEPEVRAELEAIHARRTRLGGMLRSLDDLGDVLSPSRQAELLSKVQPSGKGPKIEVERTHFKPLLLKNPNYFGNLEDTEFKPVKQIAGNTAYEELVCVGLNPPYDRLEGVITVKKATGYGGDICSVGTREYVRFFVDLFDNGVWHDVGITNVRVHDVPGKKPLCYAVRADFSPFKKFCFFENIVKVRAILQWNAAPPANPNYNPVWGNVVDVQVQIHPLYFWPFGDLVDELKLIPIEIPDPIGPVIEQLDLTLPLKVAEAQPLSLTEKKELYKSEDVPVHRFAFPEAQQLLKLSDPNALASAGKGSLVELGLSTVELDDLITKLIETDGDTSYEELRCVGLYPEAGLIEGVITVKKPTGFSGPLCGKGTTEFVAFWIDFFDGYGFQYMGTSTLNVHDLQTIPDDDVQYAVFLKKDLSKYQVPCEIGARVVRLRAILSWETAPPPGNPNFVPVWGNREECLVQLNPGELVGHIPLIETVGDIGVDDIDQVTGLGTGDANIGYFSVVESPFGGEVTITGRIGDPPNSFGGGATPYKYRIDVFGPPPFDSWQPLTNPINVKVSEWFGGVPLMCAPFEFVCDVPLTPTDDGDGFGPGWYTYKEDTTPPSERFLVVDTLARWFTNPAMEGMWQIRITAKDPSIPMLFPGVQVVHVRIDNTAPSGPAGPNATPAQIEANPPLAITGATFEGDAIPAIDCGKFPVGTIITGTYEVHDPGVTSPSQHFRTLTLDVIPDGPANGVTPVPSVRSYPVVPTTGEAGTWTLDTAGMDPCGYVIRLLGYDRTNYNSAGYALYLVYDVGFCLEEA
jgi:hypothetical protein